MTDDEFDRALVSAVFASIGRDGWPRLSVPGAAQAAGLDLARARARLPTRHSVLLRFGTIADQAALAAPADAASGAAPVHERLFDMLMRRIDVLQLHRDGVKALLAALPTDPPTALMLGAASLASMRWLLDAAGLPAHGPFGSLRAHGLLAVWLWTLRTWQTDDSPDLSATMAALDTALARAAQVARSIPGFRDDPGASPPAQADLFASGDGPPEDPPAAA
jgi:hypothetical protein